jgi:hypothetical protein
VSVHNKINLVNLLCGCIICVAAAGIALGQTTELDLRDKKITVSMDKQPLGVVFRYLMENYDLLIGFEKSTIDFGSPDFYFETNLSGVGREGFQSKDGSVQIDVEVRQEFEATIHPITVKAESERLEDVFNIIVRQMQNYKWEINDGVINIFPTAGRHKSFEKLLAVNISNFSFEKGDTLWTITKNIKKIPEFKKFLDNNNIAFSGIRTGSLLLLETQYGGKLDVEMNFSNLSFLQLLNKITKVKRGGWILRRISAPGQAEYIDIDI